MTPKKENVCTFNLGDIFVKPKHMQQFCEDFHTFCPNFYIFCPYFKGFCPDFHHIKSFGGALAHPALHLLHRGRGPTRQHSEKNWEMMVNPGMDGYTKILNHRKIPQTRKKQQILKTKRILTPKYTLSGYPVFTFSLQVGAIRPSAPRQLRHCVQTLNKVSGTLRDRFTTVVNNYMIHLHFYLSTKQFREIFQRWEKCTHHKQQSV